MDFPGFEFLKDAFNKFAAQHSGEDMKNSLLRSVAAGGKAAVDKALTEFPQDNIKAIVSDLYKTIASQDVADGISLAIRSVDAEKIQSALDAAVESLNDDKTALNVAKIVKQLAEKLDGETKDAIIGKLTEGRPFQEAMMIELIANQVTVMLDDIRSASDEEVVALVRQLAQSIPTPAIAAQLGAMTDSVTPDVVKAKVDDAVKSLPSADAIASIAHEVGGIASKHLDVASKAATSADIASAFNALVSDAAAAVEKTIANDNADKKTNPRKKGGKFDL